MKLNRTWAMVAAIVMALTLSLSGTLAYLQDTDEDVNVMTLGNVYIEQHEYERDVNADGTFKTDTIDNVTSYVLKDFTQGKALYPAVIPNGANFGYDSIPVRMSQVESHGGANVFNTSNAVDKFVTVENTGKSDAYVRTLVAFEVGSATIVDEENYPNQPLIASEIRAALETENANGQAPWTYGFMNYVTIDNNRYLFYELIYTGAMTSNGWKHENGILPAGETTYPNLCQVYMASRATNEDVEALDGNKNGLYDILVLSQAVQAAGFEDAQTALDTAFGDATEENIQAWFAGSVIASAPEAGTTRPTGYNPVDSKNPNLVSGITVTDASDKTTNLRALYTGDGNKISGDLKVEDCYLDGTYAMNVIGDDSGALTVTDTDLRGWVSYDGFTTATFTNCTFGENTNPEIYNNVRPYSTVIFENCAFDGTTFWLDKLPSNAAVTFKNCTMNGALIKTTDDVTVVYGGSNAIEIVTE